MAVTPKRPFRKGDTIACLRTSCSPSSFIKGCYYETSEDQDGLTVLVVRDEHGRPNGWMAEYFRLSIAAPEAPGVAANTGAQQGGSNILGTQVGGSHYTDMKIQPIEYIWANNIGFSEGNVIKYVSRWRAKGGIKDLKKAHHHLGLMIEREEAALNKEVPEVGR